MYTQHAIMRHSSSTFAAVRRLLLAGVCFPLALPALAQTAPTDNEVVKLSDFHVSETKDVGYRAANSVSATRVDTPIGDLPFAISAFTGQFISDVRSRDLFDVVRYSAGVTTAGREFNAGTAVYTIRGFTQAPQHDGFNEGSAGNIYVDTATVDRVEVIKGPESLLYGQVSPGGTVNYITKRATGQASASFNGQIGSYDYLRGTVDVNQPVIKDTLFVRVVGSWENGYEYYSPSKSRTTVFFPTATWNITPNLSLTVNLQYFHRSETPPAVFKPNLEVTSPASVVSALSAGSGYAAPSAALSNVNKSTAGNPDFGYNDGYDPGFLLTYPALARKFNYSSRNDQRITNLVTFNTELDGKFGDHWVGRTNLDYAQNRSSYIATGIGTIAVAPPGTLTYNPGTGLWTAGAVTTAQELAFAQQILADPNNVNLMGNQPAILPRRQRWQNTWGHVMTWEADLTGKYQFDWGKINPLAGVFYQKFYQYNRINATDVSAGTPYFRAWDLNPASPTYFIDQTTAFNKYSLPNTPKSGQFTNTLAFTSDQAVYGLLNGRFLDDRLYAVVGARYNRSQAQSTDFKAGTVSKGLRASDTTPQAGFGYKITKEVMAYASYSESFVLPAQTTLRTMNVVVGSAKPTKGEGKEVGIKTDLFGGRFSSTLAVYDILQKDVLQTVNQVNPPGFPSGTYSTDTQGASARSRGIEYEVTISPIDSVQVFGSIAEDDIRNTKEPAGNQIYLGAHPQATAKTLANLWTRYNFLQGDLKGLWLGGGFNYVGKAAADNRNPYLFLPSYWLWNSAVGYDWTWQKVDWSAALNWNNMANKEYFPANQQVGYPERIVFSVSAKF
ncbi:MAG TPA: TonB-dependent receptor [Opitutaceae bacterium]|nr:TonB-dependent receptor [Opitutaceae bacterium]